MDDLHLYTKLSTLPESLKLEVADFIDALLDKAAKKEDNKKLAAAKFGSAKGMFIIHEDFDQPLDDFEDYTQP